ncbi:MAG: hypothetical protein LBD01_05525 [Puniceicoccales bacterium]|jgi:membrane-bound serine protease (ClpP class)|nr:hypothetical protein [Puniceicoccales bacterium]
MSLHVLVRFSLCIAALLVSTLALADLAPSKSQTVYVVRLDGEIGSPSQFILRRALKEAFAQKCDIFLLDLNTPGGDLESMLTIMSALSEFPGRTVTYVNKEAISAGSYIASVTDEIWFAPNGTMGAADVVASSGAEIGETMKRKLHSYIDARVRALSGGKGVYREAVQRAMMDSDYELKIGEQVIKPKGNLLTLTAQEAIHTYGSPPQPLLAAGIAPSVDALLQEICGPSHIVRRFEKNWAEHLSLLIQWMAPVLIAIGGLCLFIEYKTPGFGAFGITGGILFFIVFAGNHAAGLAGYEPLLLLGTGLALIIVEAFFFAGTYVFLSLGLLALGGGLVWSMADIWPDQGLVWNAATSTRLLLQLGLGTLLAMALGAVAWRFLPQKFFHNRLVLEATLESGATASPLAYAEASDHDKLPDPGARGVAVTDLRLSGVVEIRGVRYKASTPLHQISRGSAITVVSLNDSEIQVRADT